MQEGLRAKFRILSARVESALEEHAVVLVTSAKPGDGTSLTAYGLADALTKIGHKVALVYTDPDRRNDEGRTGRGPVREFPIIGLTSDNDSSSPSREAISGFVSRMRHDYDYTIIDSPALLSSGVAILLASTVDGVLLSVRLGRSPSEEDDVIVRTLRNVKANVLGVVSVSKPSIASLGAVHASPYTGDARVALREHTAVRIAR